MEDLNFWAKVLVHRGTYEFKMFRKMFRIFQESSKVGLIEPQINSYHIIILSAF